ncbi:AAA family ATPase [Spirillospora sp. CA-253888]
MLYGRDKELAEVDRLLAGARRSRGGALLLEGEPGIGKSMLLDHAARQADDMRVLRCAGSEAEAELAFAGLHLLLRPLLDRLDAIPAPQARSLGGALGLTEAEGGDRFLVGLAVLSLLAGLAEERPVLCLVDDMHWIDQASADALLSAARRLEAESIALVFAARDDERQDRTTGLPELRLGRLDRTDAASLLTDRSPGLAPQVRDRVLDEADGNPLALVELPAALTPEQRSARPTPLALHIEARPIADRVQDTFRSAIAALPPKAADLLLIAAADGTGELATVLRAGRAFGATLGDLEAGERARLVRLTATSVVFRHPLIRVAVYQGARLTSRLGAHRALADALETVDDHAARRTWHLAAASTGPDERVAAALERCAEGARRHGGHAAVAAAYERAADLSPDRCERARRLIAAAGAAAACGQTRRAADLADRAAPHAADALTRASLARVRAVLVYDRGYSRMDRWLGEVADAVAGHDPDAAVSMLFDAATVAWAASDAVSVANAAERMAALRPSAAHGPLLVRAATALAQLSTGEVREGVPALRAVVEGLRDTGHPLGLRQSISAQWWYHMVAEPEAAHDAAEGVVAKCREQGTIGPLPRALTFLARSQWRLGRYRDMRTTAGDGLRIAQDTSQYHYAGHLTGLLTKAAALKGDEEGCRALSEQGPRDGGRCAESRHALGMLDLGLGRYEAALRRFEEIGASPERHPVTALYVLPDHIEAAVQLGRPERAREACARFVDWADATGRPWAEAIARRCQALLATGEDADRRYAQAVKLHVRDEQPFERARTELLYGAWLRRNRRPADARPLLRSALQIFEGIDAEPWAERARAELRATGERVDVPAGNDGPLPALTPQEHQVVRLAATGLSNIDIGARLLLSPRTVGSHLYKAFRKLGVTSRHELTGLFTEKGP